MITMRRPVSLFHLAAILVAATAWVLASPIARADKLDDVINAGKLRCGIMLDYPPLGSYNASHQPIGYDVDWCRDMAKALGVTPVIVDTPSASRIPALLAGRVDVSISGASNTLERAKSVLFSIPYNTWPFYGVTRKGTGINSFADFRGRTLGGVRGAVPVLDLQKYNQEHWNGESKFVLYNDDSSKALAMEEGKIDGFVTVLTNAKRVMDKYKDFRLVGRAPFPPDVNSIMVRRGEFGFIHWINLFIYQQVRKGRYAHLYEKWMGAEATEVPSLALPTVYY